MDKFFTGWFAALDGGLDGMSGDECSRLFLCCAERCAGDALKYLYRDLFDECGGDLDLFFSRVDEKKNVGGRVIEPGRVYELIFKSCDCDLHTRANMNSPRLCECSSRSVICIFKELVPDRNFTVERICSILGGEEECRHRIIFDK